MAALKDRASGAVSHSHAQGRVHTSHGPVVAALLQAGARTDLRDKNGLTALMLAAEKGHVSVAAALLSAGAGTDLQDNNGLTALMKAAMMGHASVVVELLRAGAGTDVDMQPGNGITALMLAGESEEVAALLQAAAETTPAERVAEAEAEEEAACKARGFGSCAEEVAQASDTTTETAPVAAKAKAKAKARPWHVMFVDGDAEADADEEFIPVEAAEKDSSYADDCPACGVHGCVVPSSVLGGGGGKWPADSMLKVLFEAPPAHAAQVLTALNTTDPAQQHFARYEPVYFSAADLAAVKRHIEQQCTAPPDELAADGLSIEGYWVEKLEQLPAARSRGGKVLLTTGQYEHLQRGLNLMHGAGVVHLDLPGTQGSQGCAF